MKKTLLLIIVLLLLISFVSCEKAKEDKLTSLVDYFATSNINLTSIELEAEFIFPIQSKAQVLRAFDKISDLLLNNYTFLSSQFEPIKYEGDNVPWDELESSYNLNINAFKDVQCLIFLYEHSGEKKYLQEAKRQVLSWVEYEKSTKSKENIYVWCDQAVAYRTLVLIHYLLYRNVDTAIYDADFISLIESYIEAQGEWLYDDTNYTLGNHGIMMDRALLQLSFYTNNEDIAEKYFAKSISRLESAIKRDFTSEGVHLENTPEYHRIVMGWFIEIKNFLMHYIELPPNTILEIATTRASDYLVRVILPNNYLPRIGDGGNTDSPLDKSYDNEYLEYITSFGNQGIIPKGGIKYYHEAGIALYRDKFDAAYVDEATWWCFKSGAKSAVHKQDDDLSLMLFAHGNEILSDGGLYNYIARDDYRKFVLSPGAHNSISIKGKSFYANKYFEMIDLLQEVKKTNEYCWYKGVNRAYAHTHIQRNLIFFEPNVFIIIDDGYTIDDYQEYTQHFLLGKEMELVEYDTSGFKAISKDEKSWIDLEQYIDTQNVKHYRADEQNGYGFISEVFEKKTPINYISFENTAKQTRYITSITINGDDSNDLSIKVDNNIIIINFNKKEYKFDIDYLKYREIGKGLDDSVMVKSQNMTRNGNTFKFELDMFNSNLLYAYYLYKDDTRIDFKDYSAENFYEYTPQEPGEYTVTYFIVKSDVEDIYNPTPTPGTKQMGVFEQTVNISEEDIRNNLKQSLEIQAQGLTKSENIYRYNIQTYNQGVLYAFYLYKDGQKIDYQDYSKRNYYEFTPKEKGEYIIKWFIVRDSVKDMYKEPFGINKKSGNSESIVISKSE